MNLFVRCWAAQARFLVLSAAFLMFAASGNADEGEVDFNAQIRPLLSNNCLTCHGPDEEERVAGLRWTPKRGPGTILVGTPRLFRGIQLPAR